MRSYFVFNGRSCNDFGLFLENLPEASYAERRGDPYQIAGRNGRQYLEDGTFENYDQIYSVGIRDFATRRDVYKLSEDVAEWLIGSRGFCRLEDTYDPDVFRLARFAGSMNFEAVFRNWGRANLVFECQPERYLKTGETAVTALEGVHALESVSYTLTNPTTFTARPLIKVTGYGGIQFSVTPDGETSVAIQCSVGSTRTTFIIDCDSYSVTYEDGTDASSIMTFVDTQGYPSFPRLSPGDNIVANIPFNGGGYIEKLEIVPRWWKL